MPKNKKEEERRYRPKLEALAIELYDVRRDKREAEKEDGELSNKVKALMDKAGIKRYDGKNVYLEILLKVIQQVDVSKLAKYMPLEELAKEGLLSVDTGILEAYLKTKGKDIKPSAYLKKGKPYESVKITRK